jgi:hypothetical protein
LSQRQNKRTTSVLIGVTITTVLVIAAFILATRNDVEWNPTFKPDDRQPYGTSVLKSLLENVRQGQEFVFISDSTFEQLPTNPSSSVDNYIYVGSNFYAEERDNDTLIKFLEAGNSVFISANNLNEDLIKKILRKARIGDEEIIQPEIQIEEYQEEIIPSDEEDLSPPPSEDNVDYYEYEEQVQDDYVVSEPVEYYENIDSYIATETTFEDSVFLQTRDDKKERIKLSFVFDFDTVPTDWSFFSEFENESILDVKTEGFFTKSRNKSSIQHVNFVSIPVGQGRLYLHTTPLALTNFSLLNKDHMEYARQIFQHLGKGKIYWGEDNRWYIPKRDPENIETDTPSEGPMEFILSEPALLSAWYTLLIGSILYMIFGVKRKQRVIPITESMQNTSIEYAEVISQLFMEQADHKKLVDLKMDMFKSNLREKYNIKLPLVLDDENEEFFKLVSIKTGTSIDLVQEIFQRYKVFSKNIIVETPEMLKFNQKIEEFYITSR